MMFALLLLLLTEVVAVPRTFERPDGLRTIRSASCDPKFTDLSSTHTMCLTDVGTDDPLSASDKQAIVDKHNDYRSNVNPTATDLVKLVWDDDIAEIAAKWSRQCISGHDNKNDRQVPSLPGVYIGQNAAAGYNSVVSALVAWHDEVNFFQYGVGNTSLEAVGHYTQVVGKRAVRIGCGQATCTGQAYPKYQICNYAMGQYTPELKNPYTSGASCNDCPAGKCTNNLCDCDGRVCLNGGTLDSATCSCQCAGIYTGSTCADKNCPTTESGYCTTKDPAIYCQQSWFRNYCPIRCDLCPGPPGCPPKKCQNGGQHGLDCKCDCIFADFYGDLCEKLNCTSANKPSNGFCDLSSYDVSFCDDYWNFPLYCPKKCGMCA